jgi:hypothetical protein
VEAIGTGVASTPGHGLRRIRGEGVGAQKKKIEEESEDRTLEE